MTSFSGPEKNQNFKSKCFYLLSLIKMHDKKLHATLDDEFKNVDVDESFEFYNRLVDIYRDLKEGKKPSAVSIKKEAKKKTTKKKVAKKSTKKDDDEEEKKKSKKKVTKKTTKKETKKKVAKKKTAKK